MLEAGLYKKTQGKKVRQGTAYAIALIFLVAAYQTTVMLRNTAWAGGTTAYIVSGLIFAFGAWFAYRIVNWPTFADLNRGTRNRTLIDGFGDHCSTVELHP